MISYAQNHEDVVLARLFRRQDSGFYIDVGAGHPIDDSVTKHFYDSGWRGVNVEPMTREYQLLCADRPDDVNACIALSDHGGSATLYEAPPENRGASTLVEEIAEGYTDETFTPVSVRLCTLEQVCDDHAIGEIDFLKIDVEGYELAVIRGGNWQRFQPRVLVVEATKPNSTVPAHEDWEPLLRERGYRCALFDGLNRFYAQHDDAEALEKLAIPANPLDDYEPWRYLREIDGSKEHIESLEAALATAEERSRGLEAALATAEGHTRALHDEIQVVAAEARALRPRSAEPGR